MTGRRATPRSIITHGLVADGLLVLFCRLGGNSWTFSLGAFGVFFGLRCASAAYLTWRLRHPDLEARLAAEQEAKAARRAEKLAQRTAAADAAHRASGRR